MKLVIDIDDKTYKMIKNAIYFNSGRRGSARVMEYNALKAIYEGKPLPKCHGRIVDENEITSFGWNNIDNHAVVDAPTIIEADKEGVEDFLPHKKIPVNLTITKISEHEMKGDTENDD